jgi:hypothetical protein
MDSKRLAPHDREDEGESNGRTEFQLALPPASELPWSDELRHPCRLRQRSQPSQSGRSTGDPIDCHCQLAWPITCAYRGYDTYRVVARPNAYHSQGNLRTLGADSHVGADDGEAMNCVERTGLDGGAGDGSTLHEREGPRVALVVHFRVIPKLEDERHLDPFGSANPYQLLVDDEPAADVLVHTGVLGLLIAVEAGRIARDAVEHKLLRGRMLPRSSQR